MHEIEFSTLEFDVEDHAYSMEGVILPGVTSVMATQFPLNVPLHRLEFAREMGKAIHSATELYDLGRLDFDSVDPRVVPYLEAWIKFKKDTGFKIIGVEQRVYHPSLGYAGTLDRVGILLDSVAIVDLKRPILGPRVGVQLMAYLRAYNEWIRLVSSGYTARAPATKRFGIQLKDDGNYRLKEFKDGADWAVFVSSLTLYNWKAKNGE